MVCCSYDYVLHRFRDITSFSPYATACYPVRVIPLIFVLIFRVSLRKLDSKLPRSVHCVREKESACWEGFVKQESFKPGVMEGVMNDESGESTEKDDTTGV